VDTDIKITEPETDVKLFGNPISIKTVTGKGLSGIKIIWTVDSEKARKFRGSYYPSCDLLLININWGGKGGLYLIPLSVQREIFNKLGRNKYIKLPKPGTNPRGVEFSKEAILRLIEHPYTSSIGIEWNRSEIEYDPYRRWVDYWKE